MSYQVKYQTFVGYSFSNHHFGLYFIILGEQNMEYWSAPCCVCVFKVRFWSVATFYRLIQFLGKSTLDKLYLAACVCIKEAEWSWITVRRVKFSQGKVYWILHNPGRGTSPQSAYPQSEPLPQRLGQPSTRRGISNPTPWGCGLAHEEGARQESTGSKNHGAGWDLVASICWKDAKRSAKS